MRVVCPVCEARYNLPEKSSAQRRARAQCKGCDSVLLVDRETKEVTVMAAPEPEPVAREAGPSAAEAGVKTEAPITVGAGGEERDYLALGVLVGVLAVALLAIVYLAAVPSGDFFGDPLDSVSRWMKSSGKGLVEKMEEKAKKLLPGGVESRRVQSHYTKGYRLYKKGKYDTAIRELTLAINERPDDYRAFFWRGRAHIKSKRYDEAIPDFEKAADLKPKYAPSYDNLGWLYGKKGDRKKQVFYLSKSIELKPENGWAYYQRGRAYHLMGDEKSAFEDAKKACELNYQDACKVYESYKKRGFD